MTDLQTRALTIRAIREDSREADFVASTEAIDSYESILRQNWDLKRFTANPVVLWAHQSRELPIGTAPKVGVVGSELLATVRFVGADVNPKAEQVWQGVKQGVIRGMSVGFDPKSVRYEKIDGREVMVLDDLELLELSVTPLPSNPDTLAKLRTRALAAGEPGTTKDVAATPRESPAKRGGERTDMDEKDKEIAALKAKLDQRDADVTEGRKAVDAERTAKAALERELDKAHAAAKAAEERAAKAETSLVERDVDALLGKKIAPAERDEMLELAKANRSLFDRIVAKRDVIGGGTGLVDGESAIGSGSDPLVERSTGDAGNDALLSDFNKGRASR